MICHGSHPDRMPSLRADEGTNNWPGDRAKRASHNAKCERGIACAQRPEANPIVVYRTEHDACEAASRSTDFKPDNGMTVTAAAQVESVDAGEDERETVARMVGTQGHATLSDRDNRPGVRATAAIRMGCHP